MLDPSDLLACWGKARPAQHGPLYHPALLHCLDVAAVASVVFPAPAGMNRPPAA